MTTTAVPDNVATATAAAAPAAASLVTQTAAEFLERGKFADYHLAKAQAAFANNNLHEAYYQVRASLAHDSLPEALAMKADLKMRLKSG